MYLRKLLSFLLLATLALGVALGESTRAQNTNAAHAIIMGSTPHLPRDVIAQYGGLYFDLNSNTYLTTNISTGVTTTYPSFAAFFAAMGGTVSSSSKWYWNKDGVLVQAPANTLAQPCYSNDGVFKGVCVESWGSNNLMWWSEDFTQATWTKTGGTITANTTQSPTSFINASTFTENTSNGNHWFSQNTAAAQGGNALTYMASCFVQGGPAGQSRSLVVRVDDNTDVNGAQAIVPFQIDAPATTSSFGSSPYTLATSGPQGNGVWVDDAGSSAFKRVSFNFTKNTANTVIRVRFGLADPSGSIYYQGNGISSLIFFGCELKQNSGGALLQTETTPTSYCKSVGANCVRAKDIITIPVPNFLANAPAYSIYGQAYMPRGPVSVSPIFGIFGEQGVSTSATTISGTTMNVAAMTSGKFAVGQYLSGSGVQPNTQIVSGPAAGGAGTYTVSVAQAVGPTTISSVAQRYYVQQLNASSNFAFNSHVDGYTGSAACGVNIPGAAGPNRVFGQNMGFAGVADPSTVAGKDYWYENSGQGSATSITNCFFGVGTPVAKVMLGTHDPASTTIGSSNLGVSSFLMIPSAMTLDLMRGFLYTSPPVNPDAITGANYLTQAMRTSWVPAINPTTAITGASWSGGNVTFTTGSAHKIPIGSAFVISGMTPSAYNGLYTAKTGTSGSTLVAVKKTDPGTATVMGVLNKYFEIAHGNGQSLPDTDASPSNAYPTTLQVGGGITTSQDSAFTTAKHAGLQWGNRCSQLASAHWKGYISNGLDPTPGLNPVPGGDPVGGTAGNILTVTEMTDGTIKPGDYTYGISVGDELLGGYNKVADNSIVQAYHTGGTTGAGGVGTYFVAGAAQLVQPSNMANGCFDKLGYPNTLANPIYQTPGFSPSNKVTATVSDGAGGSGTILDVTALTGSAQVWIGQTVTGANLPSAVTIVPCTVGTCTGVHGTGTYNISEPLNVTSQELVLNSAQGGVRFTSVTRADAQTLAYALYAAGFPPKKADNPGGVCPEGLDWCGYLDPGMDAGIPENKHYKMANGVFTGTISDGAGGSGVILNVTSVTSGVVDVTQGLAGSGVLANTTIVPCTVGTCTGTGKTGTYNVSTAHNIGSTAITATGYARTNPTTVFPTLEYYCGLTCRPFIVGVDVIIFPDGKLGAPPDWGVMKDAEMADSRAGRTASRLLALEQQLARIYHAGGYKYGIIPNPYFATGMVTGYCGSRNVLGPNGQPRMPSRLNCQQDIIPEGILGKLSLELDYMSIIVNNPWGSAFTSFKDQVDTYYAIFGSDPHVDHEPSHIALGMIFGQWPSGTTQQDADYVHNFLVGNGVGGARVGDPLGGHHGATWPGQQCRWSIQKVLRIGGLALGSC